MQTLSGEFRMSSYVFQQRGCLLPVTSLLITGFSFALVRHPAKFSISNDLHCFDSRANSAGRSRNSSCDIDIACPSLCSSKTPSTPVFSFLLCTFHLYTFPSPISGILHSGLSHFFVSPSLRLYVCPAWSLFVRSFSWLLLPLLHLLIWLILPRI
jgi:hypothetical protein